MISGGIYVRGNGRDVGPNLENPTHEDIVLTGGEHLSILGVLDEILED